MRDSGIGIDAEQLPRLFGARVTGSPSGAAAGTVCDPMHFRIPATTANLGPGYDCLGVALRLYNTVAVRRGGDARQDAMAAQAAERFFQEADVPPFEFGWEIEGSVPRSRGLGSSVTVRLGLLHGLNALCGGPLSRDRIFALCAQLEGHPDNAAPAEYGGFVVSGLHGGELRFEVEERLKFVLLIPDFEIATPAARAALPAQIAHRDAVQSSANACRITAAFASRRYELLRGCFGDHFHQPHRAPLIPILEKVIRAGETAGALGGFLSGSGSTICCLALDEPDAVAAAMASASGAGARTFITTADNEGARPMREPHPNLRES